MIATITTPLYHLSVHLYQEYDSETHTWTQALQIQDSQGNPVLTQAVTNAPLLLQILKRSNGTSSTTGTDAL